MARRWKRGEMTAGRRYLAEENAILRERREDELQGQHAGHGIRSIHRRRGTPQCRKRQRLAGEDDTAVVWAVAAVRRIMRGGHQLELALEDMGKGLTTSLAEQQVRVEPQRREILPTREAGAAAQMFGE